MSEVIPPHSRRKFLSTSAAVAAAAVAGPVGLAPAQSAAAAEGVSGSGLGSPADRRIRPFRVRFPERDLVDLRRRIVATRFPEMETVTDRSQGTQLATMQKLARYWAKEYDWRKVEAKL
ncbi:epoxide hydrolase N-terminal domain-containing protein, partial [Streptomyces sp. DT203]|uniref:epoxide hydrolase N-terminal domain-containing protein n=1 Tax=Streptomyces sp. DT203 TaxID=3393424 RepID=UPI003CEB7AC5